MKINQIKNKGLCFLLFFLLQANAEINCDKQFIIIQKPIIFDSERTFLTQQYRKQHYGIEKQSISIIPEMIVLHWTEINNFEESFKTFYPTILRGRKDIAAASKLNVSAHYLVDRDGSIYQLMPDNWMGRHVIGLNTIAIGIENVGGANNIENLTEQQVAADSYLVCILKQKYPSIKYLIGHYEYLQFRHTPLWLEKDPNYFTSKTDPGKKFMVQVRAHVKDFFIRPQ